MDSGGGFHLTGGSERAELRVSGDGQQLTARWERTTDGATWAHWMDMSFTRTG